jgi:hypothetical protein
VFEETRLSYGLTRTHLSDLTGRSVNYLLKAEQATFPCPPVSLLAFYTADQPPANAATVLGPGLSGFLVQKWRKWDKDDLKAAYKAKQRKTREDFLDRYYPVATSTSNRPFRLKWYGAIDEDGDQVAPNSYQLSCGLCIPAAVVYRNDRELRPSSAIRQAMTDLVEYVETGRFHSRFLSEPALESIELAVLRIAEEEGVKA